MGYVANSGRTPGAAPGFAFALVSAIAFGMSGTLARGLIDIGWTALSATTVRVIISAVVLIVPGVIAMRGRWGAMRTAWPGIVVYGVFAVGATQLFYFLAISRIDVSVALLLEYTAPIYVVLWMWFRHGHKPGPLTYAGGAVAVVGLIFLLDVVGGGSGIDPIGVVFALTATSGAVVYFVLSGRTDTGIPPVSMAAFGLLVASVLLVIVSALGVLPTAIATGAVQFLPFAIPWWLAVLVLGLVTSALAYVAGISGVRRLGARLASFVALGEVIAAAVFAWVLLGQELDAVQLVGALLVFAGVVLVKMGEPRGNSREEVADLLTPLEEDAPTPALP